MRSFRITYTNGDSYETNASGTLEEFTAYLMQFGGTVVNENPVTGEETRLQIEKIEDVTRYDVLRHHIENPAEHYSGSWVNCQTCYKMKQENI